MKRVGEYIQFTPKTLAWYTMALLGLGGGASVMGRELTISPAKSAQVDLVQERLGKIESAVQDIRYTLCEMQNDRRVDRKEPVRNCAR